MPSRNVFMCMTMSDVLCWKKVNAITSAIKLIFHYTSVFDDSLECVSSFTVSDVMTSHISTKQVLVGINALY